MNVLGIHAFIHDSGAALVGDDHICAIAEERLDRVKRSAAFPSLSINYVLSEFGLKDINEVDLVVYDLFEKQGRETLEGIRATGYLGKVECVRHHDAHAASAYYPSSFVDAAVLVVDGAGSNGEEFPPGCSQHVLSAKLGWMQEVQSYYRGEAGKLSLVRRTFATPEYSMGLGFVYGISCEYLGFDKLDGGKLMGLASYGRKKQYHARELFEDFDGDVLVPYERQLILDGDWDNLRDKLFPGTPRRKPGGRLLRAHKDAAFHIQSETEAAMLLLAKWLRNATGSRNLCIAGGVALNGAANSLIGREAGYDAVFVQPAANDSGIALGCALHGYHALLCATRRFSMNTAFLGKKYKKRDVERAINEAVGIEIVDITGSCFEYAARAISDGMIVGLFDGASETGPRALGARSILADPRDPGMKDRLNEKVKFRESFRPYAPAVLAEKTCDYFEYDGNSPFMLKIEKVKKGMSKQIPAVVHVDGTARLQTVEKGDTIALRKIIERFCAITGVPMLLNTSMNVSGEPIVETPSDALRCLKNTGMDLLVIGGMIIKKKYARV